MSVIIYDWKVVLKSGSSEEIAGPEPTTTDTEIIFSLEEGGTKVYLKEEVISFDKIGLRPFAL